MRTLITAAVLSALGISALTFAVVLASTAVDADTALFSTMSGGAVVVGLLAILVALFERANNGASGPSAGPLGSNGQDDRDVIRVREELRAIDSTA